MVTDWPSLLDALIDRFGSPETIDIELKSARSGLPGSMWPSVSTFANTHGGWLLLGVVEQDGDVVFEGLKNPSARMEEFFTGLRNQNKINYPVCDERDVSIVDVGRNDARILAIRIPAAPRAVRPIYIDNNPATGTYLRRHSADVRCTDRELRRLYRESSESGTDGMVLPAFTMQDLDSDSVEAFRQRFRTRDPGSPWNQYPAPAFLEAIGAIGVDRATGETGLTVAGLLLLGKDAAIRDWRHRHLIDYRRLPGDPTPMHWWDDRVTWEGNLLGAFNAIYPRLVAELATPFRLHGAFRRDEGPEQEALREALVNLLVHTDYFESDASLILRMPDGYRFRNPGDSRVSTYDLLNRDRSDPRNPRLVRMFRYAGLAEEAGQGIAKIRTLWRELGYQLPDIDGGAERYEFELRLRYTHLVSEEDQRWLHRLAQPFTDTQRIALVLSRHGEELTNARLCQLTGEHPADVTKALRELRDWALLEMERSGRWASYRLSDRGEATYVIGRATSAPTGGASAPTGGASTLSGGASTLSGGASTLSGGASTLSGGASTPSDSVRNARQEQWDQLRSAASRATDRRRMAPPEFDAILIELCATAPLSRTEIAELTVRSQNWVSQRVSALVRDGRLHQLYPEIATHPAQRYVAPGGQS